MWEITPLETFPPLDSCPLFILFYFLGGGASFWTINQLPHLKYLWKDSSPWKIPPPFAAGMFCDRGLAHGHSDFRPLLVSLISSFPEIRFIARKRKERTKERKRRTVIHTIPYGKCMSSMLTVESRIPVFSLFYISPFRFWPFLGCVSIRGGSHHIDIVDPVSQMPRNMLHEPQPNAPLHMESLVNWYWNSCGTSRLECLENATIGSHRLSTRTSGSLLYFVCGKSLKTVHMSVHYSGW